MINKFIYLLQEGSKSLWRTKIPSIVSSLAISVSLIIISISYCLYVNFEFMVLEFKDKYKIEVFFNENIIKKNAINSFNNILLLNGIEKGIFIDKESAAKIFKKNFDEDIIDIIGTNPLPMSAVYDISKSFRNYDSIQKIIKKIEKIKSVESAVYEKDAIIKFDRMVKNILAFIFFISFLIIFVAIFFVSNTILIIIYSKKKDIEILKLLGASNLFIKFPYYLEGIFQGIIGSFISISLLYLLYSILNYLSFNNYINLSVINSVNVILINVFLGILLGFLGSSKALSSYVND